jgi:hypothetical protein
VSVIGRYVDRGNLAFSSRGETIKSNRWGVSDQRKWRCFEQIIKAAVYGEISGLVGGGGIVLYTGEEHYFLV